MTFLEIKALHKTYEAAPLLSGVSFGVEQGEIACLLGASGSGKTTLLRLIAGLEQAEVGRVLLAGDDLTRVPTHRRGIVLMFQDYALFPHKTVAENVAFGLEIKKRRIGGSADWRIGGSADQRIGGSADQRIGGSADQRISGSADQSSVLCPQSSVQNRVEEMLALVGLEGFGDRDVLALSGGERQRVALARSLAPQPRLLLLDEPLGALDRNLRERLLEELPAILRRVGVTAITVTHDQEEAFALADRVILLNEGRVVQSGTPEAVYDAPANAWVARFLGLDNLFPAQITARGQATTPFGPLTFAPEAALPTPGAAGRVLVQPWGIHLRCDALEPPHPVTAQNKCDAPQNLPLNLFTAVVARRTFHGPIYRLTLRLPGGELHLTLHPGQSIPDEGAAVVGQIDPAALRWVGE